MSKSLSKVLVVVAMLTAFLGQALAYTAMPCEMSADSHVSHMEMEQTSLNHLESMSHGDMKISDTGNYQDCCSVDCTCPANACITITFLNTNNVGLTDFLRIREAMYLQKVEQPTSISTSLYRPPIFA
ncbi:hypothetical protein J8L70_06460 [Pseudoalteromonas sp. MMG010]|uniref:hypothetical protein n=1 Tax=Pseudoalteromonas sp. MMG010 TaxID=2822685 RepID=UPI001B3A5550|nr:hypothetical protein [Pseudoalteromonas sp. MMG010]MBQ4832878.1 hypothetical protein [Pseudoalteromonas sp. MMG010]